MLITRRIGSQAFHRTYQRLKHKVGRLSPYEVNQVLTANEFSQEFEDGPVKSFDSNQLGSNNPIEDSRSSVVCNYDSSLILGVFDGHGGPACGQVVSKRIMRYIAASLLPQTLLKKVVDSGAKSDNFATCLHERLEFVEEVRDIYESSFSKYVNDLIDSVNYDELDIDERIEQAFLKLDQDLSTEAIDHQSKRTLAVALSGACAVVAHVHKTHLRVASVGDCMAVLGSLSESGEWVAQRLNNEHNAENVQEIKRIINEHPENEKDHVIKSERLLGMLAPLRALGDFRFKWSREIMEKLVVPVLGKQSIPHNYHTPPYLSSRPEISHYVLTPNDKFLVMASDGLWEIMTPTQVVQLIGEYMSDRAFLQPLKLPKRHLTMGEIDRILDQRAEGLLSRPDDKNGATHLIRYALGATEYGVEHSKLSHMLSLPQELVRLFRDDITITIVYFDSSYIRTCPN